MVNHPNRSKHCRQCYGARGADGCTNGLCGSCHREHCTPGGATSPGHHLKASARNAWIDNAFDLGSGWWVRHIVINGRETMEFREFGKLQVVLGDESVKRLRNIFASVAAYPKHTRTPPEA